MVEIQRNELSDNERIQLGYLLWMTTPSWHHPVSWAQFQMQWCDRYQTPTPNPVVKQGPQIEALAL